MKPPLTIPTRIIENPGIYSRACIKAAEVLSIGPGFCLLQTSAESACAPHVSSADLETSAVWHQANAHGQSFAGRLQIDFLTGGALRVRYAEGMVIPENQTPMLVQIPEPDPTVIIRQEPDVITFKSGIYSGRILLTSFAIELNDGNGQRLTTIGGRQASNFGSWDAYHTGIVRTANHPRHLATECFSLTPGQAVYGFGEKFIGLNKAGQVIDLCMTDALGVTSPRSYKNIPFFASTQGYGVFFNHSCLMTFWVNSLDATRVQACLDDDFLDYFVFAGSLPQILDRYTGLTGKPGIPPAWTFGYWQSKISYQSAGEVLELAHELRRREIPCDVIHLDTFWFERNWFCNLEFSTTRFPDLDSFFAELKQLGFKISLWQLPYIPEGSKLFDELAAVNGFILDTQENLHDCGICFTRGFNGRVGVIDYTNPTAVKIHQQWLRRLLALGVDIIKTDFGEDAPINGVYHDGTPGHRMHNLYPLLYNQSVFEVTRETRQSGAVWARSAWAGSQRYPIHWGGDSSPAYDNMIPQLAGGLSLGMCGFPFWSQDIGGFFGDTNDQLLIRWMQFGVFLSHTRIHGFGSRELYNFSPDTLRICRDFLQLRYRLLPYILSEALDSALRSLPLARPLVLEFSEDASTWNIQDQFMFGRHLLVAPIFTTGESRTLYLPEGIWTDWWDGEKINGGRWLQKECGHERIPLYLREGAIIPLGPKCQFIGQNTGIIEEVLIAPHQRDVHTSLRLWPDGDDTIEYRRENGNDKLTMPRHLNPNVRIL
jgi:alpha-D-xyloside xylohydrolase